VCPENCGKGYYKYLYTRMSRIAEKKRKNLFFGCIRNLVCLGNERRDSFPLDIQTSIKIDLIEEITILDSFLFSTTINIDNKCNSGFSVKLKLNMFYGNG
jgi:hypothetical protein